MQQSPPIWNLTWPCHQSPRSQHSYRYKGQIDSVYTYNAGNVAHTSLSCPDVLGVSFAELDPTQLQDLLLFLIVVFEALVNSLILEQLSKAESWTCLLSFRDSTSLSWVVHFSQFHQYSVVLMFLLMAEVF